MAKELFDLRFDKSNYFGTISNKPELIRAGYENAKAVSISGSFDKIIIMGMGGSGLAGSLIQQYFSNLPIKVVKDYRSEELINSKTVVFVCSYSGNTEEALSYFNHVSATNAKIIVIASGGALRSGAISKKAPVILLPHGMPPRTASIAMFFSILRVFENSKLIPDQKTHVKSVLSILSNKKNASSMEEHAKTLALKINEKTPLIYTVQAFREVGYFWKIGFNENAKMHAFNNVIPEVCHNELNAFVKPQDYYIIFLADESDNKRIRERTYAMRTLLNNKGIEHTTIMIKGPNLMSKIFSTIHLGELTSYYLALLHKIDPAETQIIDELKKELAKKKFL